jgi:tRNA acetyltransferase TAN1
LSLPHYEKTLYLKQRLFASVDSGCNGCIFIQMHKRDGDPGPVEIVQNMMSSAASTRKHMSRFIFDVIGIYLSFFSLSLVFQGINYYVLCSYFLAYRLPSWLYFRFILRVCPAEVVCYASEEEITRAISPLVEKYFPKESPSGHKVTCYLIVVLSGKRT